MCSNFDGLLDPIRFADTFGAAMPSGGRGSVWPAYPSSFVLHDKDSRQRTARVGKFGMVPQWAANDAKYAKLGLKTYNARVETVAEKPVEVAKAEPPKPEVTPEPKPETPAAEAPPEEAVAEEIPLPDNVPVPSAKPKPEKPKPSCFRC